MGNVKGNRYWEARLPANFRRPPSGNPNPELAAFIRSKYVDKIYAATDVPDHPNIENYLTHPYAKDDTSQAAEAPTPAPAPVQTPTSAPTRAPSGLQASATAPALRAPAPAPVATPHLTTDLLGGFDELVSASTSVPQTTPAASGLSSAQGSVDPFDLLAAAPAPVAAAPAPSQPSGRTSLDWTDFHGPVMAAPAHSNTFPAPSNTNGHAHGHGHGHGHGAISHKPTSSDPFANFVDSNLAAQFQGASISGNNMQQQPGLPHHQPSMSTPGGGAHANSMTKHASAKSADEVC